MKWDENVYGRSTISISLQIVAGYQYGCDGKQRAQYFQFELCFGDPEAATNSFQRIEAIVAHEYFHNWSGNRDLSGLVSAEFERGLDGPGQRV